MHNRPSNRVYSTFDNDGVVPLKKEIDMTLAYALIADGGIVLGADSELTYRQRVTLDGHGIQYEAATYQAPKQKIQILRESNSAFSVAGESGLVDLLLKKSALAGIKDCAPFEDMVGKYSDRFAEDYQKDYGKDEFNDPHCTFLFCGYIGTGNGKFPIIKRLSSPCFGQGIRTEFEFSGREKHGAALYLHHRLFTPGTRMSLDSAKCLVYCVLSEVADMDNTVGRPIQMVVVTANDVVEIDPAEFSPYEETRKRIWPALRSLFFPFEQGTRPTR